MGFTLRAQFNVFSSKGKSSLHFTFPRQLRNGQSFEPCLAQLGDDARLPTAPAMVKAAASSKRNIKH